MPRLHLCTWQSSHRGTAGNGAVANFSNCEGVVGKYFGSRPLASRNLTANAFGDNNCRDRNFAHDNLPTPAARPGMEPREYFRAPKTRLGIMLFCACRAREYVTALRAVMTFAAVAPLHVANFPAGRHQERGCGKLSQVRRRERELFRFALLGAREISRRPPLAKICAVAATLLMVILLPPAARQENVCMCATRLVERNASCRREFCP